MVPEPAKRAADGFLAVLARLIAIRSLFQVEVLFSFLSGLRP